MPITNLSNCDIDSSCLKCGLHNSLIDNNGYIKRDLGVELESLATNVHECFSKSKEFHQFLRNTTHTLTNNIYHTKYDIFNKTKSLRDNRKIVVINEIDMIGKWKK